MTNHIAPSILAFLADIKANNSKTWFDANRGRYDAAKVVFVDFVQQMIASVVAIDSAVEPQEAAKCVYRINRDVRFSPDKSPYKRHFAAFVAPGGRKSPLPGYYLHIQPGESFFCSGNCCLAPQLLKRLRTEISNFPEELHEIVTNPDFQKRLLLSDDEKLKSLPRGFSIEPQYAEYLKHKNLNAMVRYSDAELTAPDFADRLAEDMRLAQPLNAFFLRALQTEPEDDVTL